MKNLILTFACLAFALSCTKENQKIEASSEQNEVEIHSRQETQILHSSKGDTLRVTYLALGDKVAVEIQKNQEPGRKLEAKTVSTTGNPVFADEELKWEMGTGNIGGKLSDAEGNAMKYLPVDN